MTPPSTKITLHQAGALRIEIAAIVMLLTALVIVLVTNAPSAHQSDIAQAGEAVQVLPGVNNAGVGISVTPRLQLQPTAGPESDTL